MREERDMGAEAKVGVGRLGLLALIGALLAILLVPSSSLAIVTKEEALFRIDGKNPRGIATDPVTGHILLPGSGDRRINEYTPWGKFIGAFGWNVAPGAVNEQQELRVRAASGAYKLTFGAATTPDLPYNAKAAEVQSALNALASIGGAGGEVAVTERPGAIDGTTPFIQVVAFRGSLAGKDVSPLEAVNGSTPLSGGKPKTELEVRTRADGAPAGVGPEACTEESGCQKSTEGSLGGQINSESLAVAPDGDVYLREAARIQQFSPSGRFIRAFGGDTIRDGAAGTGVVTSGSAFVTEVTTTEKAFKVSQPIEGTGIEPGTTVAAISEQPTISGAFSAVIVLSQPAGSAATGKATAIATPAAPKDVPSNEKQTIALGSNTTGGTFGLSYLIPPFRGETSAGFSSVGFSYASDNSAVTATTASGSSSATSLKGVWGTANFTAGSKAIANVSRATREDSSPRPNLSIFSAAAGEEITGAGIPPGTTLVFNKGEELELSSPATASGTGVAFSLTVKGSAATTTGSREVTVTNVTANATLTAGSTIVTGLGMAKGFTAGDVVTGPGIPGGTGTGTLTAGSSTVTGVSGTFVAGERIVGQGIQAGARIEAVQGNTLKLSGTAQVSGTGVPLRAFTVTEYPEGKPSELVKNGFELALSVPAEASGTVVVKGGGFPFLAGQSISGSGIPAGTTIVGVAGNRATLSAPATATASEAPVSADQRPFLTAGEAVSGPGIPASTTIESVAANGDITLSSNATASAGGAALQIGIPYDASAATLQSILESMPNIGAGNVGVSGAAAGPWTVEFKGVRFADTDVEQLQARVAGLTVSSGARQATVTSENAEEFCEAPAECQEGAQGVGPGQLGTSGPIAISSNTDTLYVGDGQRIRQFEPGGAPLGDLPDPDKAVKNATSSQGGTGRIDNLATSPTSGDLYFDSEGQNAEFVYELNSSSGKLVRAIGLNPSPARSDSHGQPTSLATDAAGDLYVADGERQALGSGAFWHLIAFDATGNRLAPPLAEEEECEDGENTDPVALCEEVLGIQLGKAKPGIPNSYDALAIGPGGDLYASASRNTGTESFVQAYGPIPLGLEAPPAAPPSIEDTYAISVDTTGAQLQALINPHFFSGPIGATRYYVQYGPTLCVEAEGWEAECVQDTATPPGSRLRGGAVSVGVKTTVFLSGLTPATEYSYRYVAESNGVPGQPVHGAEASFATAPESGAAHECPENEAFRSGPSGALPDCRAFEMVSPVDKNGGDIRVGTDLTEGLPVTVDQSSEGGERFAFGSSRSSGDAEAAPYTTSYLAAREADGWRTHGISPPGGRPLVGAAGQLHGGILALSPDLCQAWFRVFTEGALTEASVPGQPNVYRRTDDECGGPGYEDLAPVERPKEGGGPSVSIELQGLAADGGEAFVASDGPLVPEAPALGGGKRQLYESSEGQLRFVCLLPTGRPVPLQCSAGYPSRDVNGFDAEVHNAVSADGERVFWTPVGGLNATLDAEAGPLYLRRHPSQPQSVLKGGFAIGIGKTTNKSTAVTSLVTSEGTFAVGQRITGPNIPLGTTIAAVKAGELTLSNAATGTKAKAPLEAFGPCTEAAKACTVDVSEVAESQSGTERSHYWTASRDGSRAIFLTGKDLYEARIEEGGEGQLGVVTNLIAHQVLGKLGASEDARRIYFASGEVLTAGPNAEGHSPTAGKVNLYLYDAEKSGPARFAFVGTLAEEDLFGPGEKNGSNALEAEPGGQAARVSSDGSHATFDSWAPLTGYDNRDINSGEADAEVYLYDAEANEGAGKLVCASCNPSGARPVGENGPHKAKEAPFWVAGEIPAAWNQLSTSRPLSENGRRLFFDSFDALVPRDTNGKEDVYEWEAPGEGSCTEEDAAYRHRNGGCIYLISSGTSPEDSEFLDATPDGSNVFFTTLESLLSFDPGLIDVYDAREGGGLPPPPTPAPSCEGEACQGTPEAPNDPTPSSESFEGAGNVREPPLVAPLPKCAKGKVRRHGKCVAKHGKKAHRRAKRNGRAGR